jgi:DNA-binding Xre family transcriptional regulator
MTMKFKIVPERIAEAMLRAGTNARALAKATGISEVSMYKAVNGKTAPRNSTLKKICDVLNVDPAEVCELVSEDQPPTRRPSGHKLPPSELERMKTDFDPPTGR